MIRIDLKPIFFRLLRRVPMPVIAILVGLVAGLAVWGVLEQIQSRQVKKIFDEELSSRLDLRSRESLIRFDQYLANYGATTRLLANHRRLAEYLEPIFWTLGEVFEPERYQMFRPEWLPDFFERNALSPPSHVLLVDRNRRIREVFQTGDEPVPAELAESVGSHLLDDRQVRTVLTDFGDRLYLVASDAVEDLGGFRMGSLVVLVPVNARFLEASQQGLSSQDAIIALVDSDEQRILVSIDPQVLIPETLVAQWTDDYVITSRSLSQYEGSDWNPLLTTFISHAGVDKMSRHVRLFEERQRGIAALVFITVFTLVIYLVSARLNKVLKRMSHFSHKALGIEQPGFRRGANQLILLEDWIQQFTRLVLRARDEMSRKHESEMRESEALKAAIMEASLDSIVTLNRRGEIIEFNPIAERTLGFNRKDVLGRSFSKQFLARSARETFLRLLRDCRHVRRKGQELLSRTELTARRADGTEFPVELSIAPINLEEKFFYTLYLHDITKRKGAEQESRRHQAELVHVCRLSTMGEVATGMAHEINQPLAAITNYANGCSRRLQAGPGKREELLDAMGQIASQAQRASEIIRRLRALVGKQPPIRSRVDLNHLVREVCSFVEFETGKMGLDIELDLAPGGIPVDVDLVQIEQVLLNLVRNAMDALLDVAPQSRRLLIRTWITADCAQVEVADTGPGIPPERMQRLFDPFFTTKETGMGMGLPISQTIVENHGGVIRSESPASGGAVFAVCLPLADAEPGQPDALERALTQ